MRAKIILKTVIISILPFLLNAAKAPDFTVTDFNKKSHSLYADYLNKDKVLVIKFFFVGCPPCKTIAPFYQQSYVRWGAGTGKVEFMEVTIYNDGDDLVKAYHNTEGFTFPGISADGGAGAVKTPYVSGQFGSWYGTPTFIVIAPNGDVNYNVPLTTTDHSQLDTAIAKALRLTNGGGGGICTNAFSVKTITQVQPETYYIMDLLNGNPANEIKNGTYNCEFNLAQNIDGYYVIPQINAVADPLAGVSTVDIVYIQRYILGIQTFNNLQRAVADVNNSSTISAADISEIKRLVLGVTAKFSKLTKSYVVVHNPKSTNPIDLTDKVLVKDLVSKAKVNEFGIGKYGDVTGANLFANDELIKRSSDVLKFIVETNQLSDGSYEHKFYTNEDHDLTAFQFELKGKVNNIIGITASAKFDAPHSLDYNLNLAPDVVRLLGTSSANQDIHFAAGETWFSIITKSSDHLNSSHFNNFKYEFLLDQFTKVVGSVDLEYLLTSAKGESVILSQNGYNEVVLNSNTNMKNIQIINSNGYSIFSNSNTTKEIRINESSFQSGMYFAKVQLEDGKVETKKFIKF